MKRLIPAVLACLLLSACAGPEAEVTPSSEPKPSFAPGPVFTDWSKLDDYQATENHYTRYYAEYTDRLLPVEGGYGSALLPFAGAVLATEWGVDEYRYGLVTTAGEVVCDPVYDSIYRPSYYDYDQERAVELEDVLILTKTRLTEDYDPNTYQAGERCYTVAAADGSWLLEEEYRNSWTLSDGRLLLMDQTGKLWFCDSEGRLERSPLDLEQSSLYGELFALLGEDWMQESVFEDGMFSLPSYDPETGGNDGCWLADAQTGQTKFLPDVSYCYGWSGGYGTAGNLDQTLYGYLDRSGAWVIPPQFRWANPFQGNYALVALSDGTTALIDRTGAVVLEPQGDQWARMEASDGSVTYWDYYMCNAQWLVYGVYDETLQPVDHPAVGEYLDAVYTVAALREESTWTLYDGGDTWQFEAEGAEMLDDYADGRVAFRSQNGSGIYDCAAGTWIVPFGTYAYFYRTTDGATTVYCGSRMNSSGVFYDVLGEDGRCLARTREGVLVWNGLIRVIDNDSCAWLDGDGNVVFRWVFTLGTD